MNMLQAEAYCLSLPLTSEDMPFDDDTLVFRVANKIFALVSLSARPTRLLLKCDPELAIDLREKYRAVEPAFHMNKKHWNQIYIESELGDEMIRKLVLHSYCLVCKGFSAAFRRTEGLDTIQDPMLTAE